MKFIIKMNWKNSNLKCGNVVVAYDKRERINLLLVGQTITKQPQTNDCYTLTDLKNGLVNILGSEPDVYDFLVSQYGRGNFEVLEKPILEVRKTDES